MFYRQKFDTFIRIYDNAGYITNKSDFGDRVTDASGAVFLKALSRAYFYVCQIGKYPKSLSLILR
jgi:hypothetical protein